MTAKLSHPSTVANYGRTPTGLFYYAMEYLDGIKYPVLRIKPANIILCTRGGVPDVAKVVDFGLVKAVLADDADATMIATSQQVLTGTPMYMAPEAIKGEQFVDGRSDHALGAVGYYLLTGEPLFPSDTVVEVVAHHLHTVPEPPSKRSGISVPPELEAILMRCLEKAPPICHGPRIEPCTGALCTVCSVVSGTRSGTVGGNSDEVSTRRFGIDS